ncbi:MFS transporter [Actinokineospora spheciospongiae]|uniref:MFS transporter n=1 Tax=Actinokineospora spheciospongiae TaxID=909613 RepID=UPI000D710915|nr:MFS transporter [Actinokineospora spheciospongiae]PWW59546.1 putative MFS family arabinose efflux permease [Actinokineospora spheciospongiae]
MRIAVVQVLALAVWFSVSAVVPGLRQEWGIGAAEAVWLTGAVQVGFVVGAVGSAALTLADRVRPHLLLAACALAAAACTAVLAVAVDGMAGAVPLRFLTGVCLAGVYPVGMKLMASWSESATRGRSLGILVGALTVGSALPHLLGGVGHLPWRGVLAVAAGLGVVGAVVAVVSVRPGPHAAVGAPPRNPRYAVAMFGERGPRLVNFGYFGHMWELYALWTWLPAFLVAAGTGGAASEVLVFFALGVAGVVGCLLGGWASDRCGRSSAAVGALAVSGACCLLSPIAFAAGPAALAVLCVVWGAAVIADSGVFSTVLSETADQRYVGTALTAQTALGFTLTTVSIALVPVFAEAAGWRYAFLLLAPGPLVGAVAMRVLRAGQPPSGVDGRFVRTASD